MKTSFFGQVCVKRQWQYCTSYRMIYFLYEVNCCFLSILLHKYLILCFFTSYSREIIIRKKFWSHPAAKWICYWLFLLHLSILVAACLRQMEMSHAKGNFLGHIWQCLHFKVKQRVYFIFYPFYLNLIHIYRIFCLKLLHFYFLYEVLLFMKHHYCHCFNNKESNTLINGYWSTIRATGLYLPY